MAEIRCPKCGSRMILPMTKGDDLRHYICSNRPACTEKIAVENAWAYMWEEGRPTGPGAAGIYQPKKSSQSRTGTAGGSLEEGKRWFGLISKRSKRKGKAPVHKFRGDGHGRAKKSLRPQPPGVMQSDMDARKKKRFPITITIIIIAMTVACIVELVSIFYTLLVLR